MNEHTPNTPMEFWCNKCDSTVVDSTKPETGQFFLQSGHAFNHSTKQFDGEYHMVMFALCTKCRH